MKFFLLPVIFILASCTNSNEKLVREHLEKSMNLAASNLEIEKIEIGEKVAATPKQKQNLALLGLKDSTGYPITVTFKTKDNCVAIAEAIKNDVLFNEKKVSCRSVKEGEQPDLKFIKSYKIVGFGKSAKIYEDGKLIKAGETFSARGELLHMTNLKDEQKTGTIFLGIN